MVVPLILGKIAKDLLDGDSTMYNAELTPLIIGFLTAFITGIIACKWMIKIVKNGKLIYFSAYCLVVGTLAIGFSII